MNQRPEHERILQALAAGEIQESAREAQEHLRACSTCAETWKAMRRDMRSLDRTFAQARSARRAANSTESSAPGSLAREEATVEARLRAEIARSRAAADADSSRSKGAGSDGGPNSNRSNGGRTGDGGIRRRGTRRWLWIAVAATVLAGGSITWLNLRGRNRGDELLGPSRVVARDIQPLASGGLLFARGGDPSRDEIAEAEIEGRADANAPWSAVHVVPGSDERARVAQAGWIAEPELVRTWPRELRWRIVLRDLMGAHRGESEWSRTFHLP
jgi:hypothetical protein